MKGLLDKTKEAVGLIALSLMLLTATPAAAVEVEELATCAITSMAQHNDNVLSANDNNQIVATLDKEVEPDGVAYLVNLYNQMPPLDTQLAMASVDQVIIFANPKFPTVLVAFEGAGCFMGSFEAPIRALGPMGLSA